MPWASTLAVHAPSLKITKLTIRQVWKYRWPSHPSPPAVRCNSSIPTVADPEVLRLHPLHRNHSASPAIAKDPAAASALTRLPTLRTLIVCCPTASPIGYPLSLVTIVHYKPMHGLHRLVQVAHPRFLILFLVTRSRPQILASLSRHHLYCRCQLSGSPVTSRGLCLTA